MVRVLGHRGVRQHKGTDENSIPAFERALNESDGIETDVVVSKDKTPFLCHETRQITIPKLYTRATSSLKRHLNRASAKLVRGRRIDQLASNDVDCLKLRKGSKLPRLAELFELASQHPGKILDIELKGYNTVAPVIAEIHKAIAAGKITKEQVILTSFDHAAIVEARKIDPEIKCGMIFARRDMSDKPIYPWENDSSRVYAPLDERTLTGRRAREANPDYFVMTARSVTPENIAKIQKHYPNAKIMIWTTKRPERDRVLKKKLANPEIASHIDTIITDFPAKMTGMLKQRGLRP
ncbi:MAG TPA: glycerophosphodiester phosphodiesterase [Patescibacteria group bacterium]|nr:glycerophosphodiester phosphodiesterase [Patescibacteria group bacterium]